MTSSPPGRTWSRSAISLHIVPLGRNRRRSCPELGDPFLEARRGRVEPALLVSPTSAAAIAARMPSEGRVCVSL